MVEARPSRRHAGTGGGQKRAGTGSAALPRVAGDLAATVRERALDWIRRI